MSDKDKSALFCDSDPASITVEQALAHIRDTIQPITETETVPLRKALGRVTAKDIVSSQNVPNHTNSAMDGYAVNGDDLPSDKSKTFELVGASFAGAPFDQAVGKNQCVRIMTGAVMPDGTDSVVIQENVVRKGGNIVIKFGEKKCSNVRYAGEDIKQGDVAIPNGTKIGSSHFGLAASLGKESIEVLRRPKIAYFSNGDELRSIGTPLKIGEVYDSNRYTLHAMLSELGITEIDLGVVKDDEKDIADAFGTAAESADLIITTAGASVGDADFIKQTIATLGEISFWKVAVKPGRPLSFGKLRESLFFGLPGNPVSVMVTFQIFVKPAIKQLSGERFYVPMVMKVKTLTNLKKRPGRMEYQRGVLSLDQNGETVVSSTGEQGSGILSSMSQANCFVILPNDSQGAKAGEWVEVQPFDQGS